MLLSRVAGRIYWAARYVERAEDTARLVRAHGELMADLPPQIETHWEPLVAVVGSDVRYRDANGHRRGRPARPPVAVAVPVAVPVAVAVPVQGGRSQSQSQSQSQGRNEVETRSPASSSPTASNPSSVVSSVMAARENLRTTRDTVPRDGWVVVNDLYLYVTTEVGPWRRSACAGSLPDEGDRRRPAHRRCAGDRHDPRRGVRHVAAGPGASSAPT